MVAPTLGGNASAAAFALFCGVVGAVVAAPAARLGHLLGRREHRHVVASTLLAPGAVGIFTAGLVWLGPGYPEPIGNLVSACLKGLTFGRALIPYPLIAALGLLVSLIELSVVAVTAMWSRYRIARAA